MKIKKVAKQGIEKLNQMVQELPVTPDTYTYIHLYQCLQELYVQGKYELVIGICADVEQDLFLSRC